MKAVQTIKWASSALVLFAAIHAYAQPGGSAASVPAVSSAMPSEKAANKALAADVRGALKKARRQGLKSTYIRVHANNGTVTLSGVVADASQIPIATQVAKDVAGVNAVISKLEVRSDIGEKGGQ